METHLVQANTAALPEKIIYVSTWSFCVDGGGWLWLPKHVVQNASPSKSSNQVKVIVYPDRVLIDLYDLSLSDVASNQAMITQEYVRVFFI